eukprot:2434735-Rhodomonas_salina.3
MSLKAVAWEGAVVGSARTWGVFSLVCLGARQTLKLPTTSVCERLDRVLLSSHSFQSWYSPHVLSIAEHEPGV